MKDKKRLGVMAGDVVRNSNDYHGSRGYGLCHW